MKYLISRANYERCTAGMTAAERAAFDREHTIYPDRQSPDGQIDVTRLADRFLELQAAEAPDYRTPGVYWSWTGGRQFGKLARARGAQERAERFPPEFDMIDPDRAGWYGGPSWLPAVTLVEDITYDNGVATRRYFLSQWTEAADRDPVADQARAACARIAEMTAAAKEATDELADRTGVPRHLLY